MTPLVLAIENDCPGSVKTLIAAGSSLEKGIDRVDETALHVAARLNRASCLEVMSEGKDNYLTEFEKMLVVKNKLKMIPVMVTEDPTCIEVSFVVTVQYVHSSIVDVMTNYICTQKVVQLTSAISNAQGKQKSVRDNGQCFYMSSNEGK